MLVTAFGLWVAEAILPGFEIEWAGSLLLAALLLGIVNAIVRPIVILLTLPITVLTLGIFLLVVNGLMLALVAALLEDVHLSGLGSAILAWIVVGLTSWAASWAIGGSGRVEMMVVRR